MSTKISVLDSMVFDELASKNGTEFENSIMSEENVPKSVAEFRYRRLGTLKVAVIVMVTKWPQKSYFFEDRMNF